MSERVTLNPFRHCCYALTAIVVLMIASASHASIATLSGLITFDDLTPTANSVHPDGFTIRTGGLTFLQFETAGVTVDIYREGGAGFDLVNNFLPTQTGKPDGWGSDIDLDGDVQAGTADRSVSLDAFDDPSNLGFVFSFSDPIQGFSLIAGDFGRDLDELVLTAYSGEDLSGGQVGSAVYDYLPGVDGPTWTDARFEITDSSGFQSVLFKGGLNDFDVFVDRVFISLSGNIPADDEIDNPQIDGDSNPLVVPEPMSGALLVGGLALMMRRRRDHIS